MNDHSIPTQNFTALMNRYHSVIPNPEQLLETLQQPLPATAWSNPLKITAEQCQQLLLKDGCNTQAFPWWQHGFRYHTDSPLGKSWQYQTGLLQIQEEVSMLPALLLNPQPHETVLDLCAAPGNKTAQAAVMMQNTGVIYANDRNLDRLRATGQIIKRLGLINVNVSIHNGIHYPLQHPVFDKVIVDAPCSCEGTLRKHNTKTIKPNPSNSQRLAATQIALLKKAISLTKPGGTIAYSTCTFAPEENEAVIDTILNQYPMSISLLAVDLPHFTVSPGLTHWQGRDFHPSLKHAWRIWPHLNNTGGFFIALLKKSGSSHASPLNSKSLHYSPRVKTQLQTLKQRFGFSDTLLQQYRYPDHSRRGLYLTSTDNTHPQITQQGPIKLDSQGLFFIKTKLRFPKLSTGAAMLLGQHAKYNIVFLTEPQLSLYLTQQDLEIAPSHRQACCDTGYVIIKYRGICLGLGLLFARDPSQHWPLRSLFPRTLA